MVIDFSWLFDIYLTRYNLLILMKLTFCRVALALILLQFSTFSYGQTITQQLTPEQIASRVAFVYGNDFVSSYPALVTTYGKLMTDRIEYQFSVQDDTEKFPLLSSFSLITKNNPAVEED